MVERQEAIRKFVKTNLKLLLSSEFLERVYKENKKEYFDNIRYEIGIVKDTEVAEDCLDYLFKIKHFKNDDDLGKVLGLPFFSKYIDDATFFRQKLLSLEIQPEIDIKALQKEEYRTKKIEELKEIVIKERTKEIDEEIKRKEAASKAIPSVLDEKEIYPEPIVVKEQQERIYPPWWQELKLRADPFPTIDGLGSIKEEYYEDIIIKTSVYEKYVSFIRNNPVELFKNTVFFGQFGSGKTTLFEYLQKPLITKNIIPIFIRLPAEPDYQNFLIHFKQKLCRELVKTYQDLSGGIDLTTSISSSLDDSIRQLFQQINSDYHSLGFVIMIDDIYKIEDYTGVALKFLNHLQTFKGELTRETSLSNIGFFISAPLDWIPILENNLKFSGSVSRQESMPMITMHETLTMLNKRLEIFALDKQNVRQFQIEFVHQIYRRLESRHALTFRQFIKEVIRQFENRNFDILTSNPVIIEDEKLKRIQSRFEQEFAVKSGIDNILKAKMTDKNKQLCFDLLMQISYQRGIAEESDIFKNRIFYFNELRNASLIIKARNENGKTVWKVIPELAQLINAISSEYSLAINDYFYQIYGNRLAVEKSVINVEVKEEVIKCKKLLNNIKDRKNLQTVYSLILEGLKLHEKIMPQLDTPSINIDQKALEKNCYDCIEIMTRAVALFSGYKKAVGLDFWNNFWDYPDSVSEYIKRSSAKGETSSTRIWYIGSAYVPAFSDILDFLDNQIEKSQIFSIPVIGLKSDEIREFDDARNAYSKGDYGSAVTIISRLLETKIREFLFNIMTIQYGEHHDRMKRIPSNLHDYINKNIKQDRKTGLDHSNNEFIYLNRHDYKSVILGPNSPGNKNWAHTFSKIFFDWNEHEMSEFLEMFARFNLNSSHVKDEILTNNQQSAIYTYMTKSILFIQRTNHSYLLLFERIQRTETGVSPKYQYFFSLDECKDLQELASIRVMVDQANRLMDMWKRQHMNYFDLSNHQQLEQKYGIAYRELYAVLAVILKSCPSGLDFKIVQENSPEIIIEVKEKLAESSSVKS